MFLQNTTAHASALIAPEVFTESKWYESLLSLRGLIGYGILEYCLSLRHRVNYGVDTREGNRRLAVPFVACDVPSDRSEFAHPDCALVFTMLSYLYDGLTHNQVREAIEMLLSIVGEDAQNINYSGWFELSESRLIA